MIRLEIGAQEFLHRLRRGATQLAVRQAIRVTAALPVATQRSLVRSAVALAGHVPMLRRRVRENMCLAFGTDVPLDAEHLYFRHLGWYMASAMSTFHYGILATAVPDEVGFDESASILDEAIAEERGVIVVSPHWSGHELMGAMISRRRQMAMLVRQAPTSERMARKLKWYKALGAETVLRPSRASTIKDAAAYLRILKQGKLLGITPDLLADPGQGVEARIFGRTARLHAGAFALAIAARAPMIRPFIHWQSDTRVVITFERASMAIDGRSRDDAIRAAVQDWCCWFEEKLTAHPDHWEFWLDKRWSRFLRTTPRTTGTP